MATNVQRGGFGFEKFFRRISRSPSPAKEAEENIDKKSDKDTTPLVNSETSKSTKSLDQISTGEKNVSPDGKTLANGIDDSASQTTNVTKKSTNKITNDETKANEKTEELETCKELIIKDDAGQVKLTEIINNSIKEAVLKIVKEGVCPLADSLDTRGKEEMKKPTPTTVEETQDKENKPGNSKRISSLLSAEKTFDSHLCRSQFQPSTQYQPSTSPRSPQRVNEHEKPTFSQCNRDLCPRVVKERKPKTIKPKEKKPRENVQKIPRQVKGTSHFKTDNRRMTGNVNIYICSEANENAKDPKEKPEADDETCLEESESASETKTSASSLSVSTSKLIAALRKKRHKNMDDESLTCRCDIPESCPKEQRSIDKIEDNDVCGVCDENGEPGSTDTRSSSSRDGFLCDEAKFSDLDFPGSGTKRDSDLGSLDNYSPCTSEDSPIRQDSYQRVRAEGQGKNQERDLEERYSCCDLKRCQREWKSQPEKTCRRESRERTSWMQREENGQGTNKCPCIVEEEDEDCCAERKKSEEFTICVNKPVDEIPEDVSRINELYNNPSQSSSTILRGKTNGLRNSSTLRIASTPDVETTGDQNSSKVADDSKTKKPETSKIISKQVEEFVDPSESPKNNGSPVMTEGKRRNSFFYRSMKKAMSMVKPEKEEDAPSTETAKKPVELTPLAQEKLETYVPCGEEKDGEPCVPSCCGAVKEKPIPTWVTSLNPEKRSMSRITTAIANRRSSAGPKSDSSKASISICTSPINKKQETKDQCKCKKPPESCECSCRKPELVKDESCQCCPPKSPKITNDPNACCKKLETPRSSCPTCRNPTNSCVCRTIKYEPIEPKPCEYCPKCKRPIDQCNCCCPKQDKPEEESCDCCCRPKRLCSCDSVRIDAAQSKKCRGIRQTWENCQRCNACCTAEPRNECRCQRRCQGWEDRGMKSMICIYCDNPQDNCVCRAPIRKCSECCLPLDVCNCKPTPCCECKGRDVVITDDCNERTMCVTAWKPRRSIGRYFARSVEDPNGNSDEECVCWEKCKPYGSDKLAYQKRGVFSDVMSELQQKISGSVCCTVCGKEPCCCCCVERESEEKIQIRPRTSNMGERRSPGRSQKRSQSRSSTDTCKCNPRRKNGREPARICDRCETSPCRCGEIGKSSRKKPQAKCYYCKQLPCVCSTLDNPCSLRNADSSNRRSKEYRGTMEEKINGQIVDKDNRHRARDAKRFVPCPGNQQQIRKYCYRENSNGHPLHPSQRV